MTLKLRVEPTNSLKKELVQWVRHEIGPLAAPDVSCKGRRTVRDPLGQDHAPHPVQDAGALGNTSTLADPAVVDRLLKNRGK